VVSVTLPVFADKVFMVVEGILHGMQPGLEQDDEHAGTIGAGAATTSTFSVQIVTLVFAQTLIVALLDIRPNLPFLYPMQSFSSSSRLDVQFMHVLVTGSQSRLVIPPSVVPAFPSPITQATRIDNE